LLRRAPQHTDDRVLAATAADDEDAHGSAPTGSR
jgi:hypothetical protein